jgi:hypothetical protein
MSYTTPVTDRTTADIAARNSKAYFNVADWTRIYRNAQLVNSLVEISVGTPNSFPVITAPTTTAIPLVTDFNSLLLSIENFRTASAPIEAVAPTEIKHDWVAGVGQLAPKYTDVNLWETTINAIWIYLNGSSYAMCPTLSADLTLATATTAIYINCIDTSTHIIDLQGTSKLFIL